MPQQPLDYERRLPKPPLSALANTVRPAAIAALVVVGINLVLLTLMASSNDRRTAFAIQVVIDPLANLLAMLICLRFTRAVRRTNGHASACLYLAASILF